MESKRKIDCPFFEEEVNMIYADEQGSGVRTYKNMCTLNYLEDFPCALADDKEVKCEVMQKCLDWLHEHDVKEEN